MFMRVRKRTTAYTANLMVLMPIVQGVTAVPCAVVLVGIGNVAIIHSAKRVACARITRINIATAMAMGKGGHREKHNCEHCYN
jgi:hypothetical protein